MRRLYLSLIALGMIVFLGVSALLARVWSADGAERSAITQLVKAEARGDQGDVLSHVQRCRESSACRARVAEDVAVLKHPGAVSILQIQASTGFSLTSTTGTARVAWNAGSSLPFVQCVRVRRAGDAVRGLQIELLAISSRIKSDQDCPASF